MVTAILRVKVITKRKFVDLPDELGVEEGMSHCITTAQFEDYCIAHTEPRLIRGLSLRGCRAITSMAGAGRFSALQQLNLQRMSSLRDITALAGLTALSSIDFSGCPALSNIEALADLKALTRISFAGCVSLTDLRALHHLPNLEIIDISEDEDAGLFGSSGRLESISAEQVAMLKAANPLLRIEGMDDNADSEGSGTGSDYRYSGKARGSDDSDDDLCG